ncbi:MAG: hypothetical protein ABI939_03100 [Anaerolineaceae bacterium]
MKLIEREADAHGKSGFPIVARGRLASRPPSRVQWRTSEVSFGEELRQGDRHPRTGRAGRVSDAQPHRNEPLRFADILTTASAAAHYLGGANVAAEHLLYGIAILKQELTIEDLGRAVSPLVRRTQRGTGGTVEPVVRELAQRWFVTLGSDANATISPQQLVDLIEELQQMRPTGEEPSVLPD